MQFRFISASQRVKYKLQQNLQRTCGAQA